MAGPEQPTVTFFGVRGSSPCDGHRYERYGGNTSSVLLEVPGRSPIAFDLGSGVRDLGDRMLAGDVWGGPDGRAIDVLLTHLHWDHIIGMPFFVPAFLPDTRMTVHGPVQPDRTLREAFTGMMQPPYFPITPDEFGAGFGFADVGAERFALGDARVLARWVRHTDPALGFRVDVAGASVTYVSDHGPGCVPSDPDDFVPDDVVELCDGVDLLIHDAQYTKTEYDERPHFGHSSIEYAVHVAAEAGARALALFHHCPSHGDDAIDAMLDHARDLSARRNGPEVFAACEGQRVVLASPTPTEVP